MKRILKLFILIFTFFNIFCFSSCTNNFTKIEIPVTSYKIYNSQTKYGDDLILFYVPEDFRYSLSSFYDIEIEFTYKPLKGTMNKTVTESGESNGDHFIVIVSEAVNDKESIEIKSVYGMIENRLLLDEDKQEGEVKEEYFSVGSSFLIGLIISLVGIGASYLGAQVIDDEKGQILHGAGVLFPIIFTVFAFISVGIWQGVILALFNIAQLFIWFGVIGRG